MELNIVINQTSKYKINNLILLIAINLSIYILILFYNLRKTLTLFSKHVF